MSPSRRPRSYAVSTRWEQEVAENGPVKDFHRFFCCCARRLGNMFVLCERSDGSPIVVAGPCWPFCVFVTLPLILSVSAGVAYFVIISDDSPLVSDGIGELPCALCLSEFVRGRPRSCPPFPPLSHAHCLRLEKTAPLGGLYLLSRARIRPGIPVLRELPRSGFDGAGDG